MLETFAVIYFVIGLLCGFFVLGIVSKEPDGPKRFRRLWKTVVLLLAYGVAWPFIIAYGAGMSNRGSLEEDQDNNNGN